MQGMLCFHQSSAENTVSGEIPWDLICTNSHLLTVGRQTITDTLCIQNAYASDFPTVDATISKDSDDDRSTTFSIMRAYCAMKQDSVQVYCTLLCATVMLEGCHVCYDLLAHF